MVISTPSVGYLHKNGRWHVQRPTISLSTLQNKSFSSLSSPQLIRSLFSISASLLNVRPHSALVTGTAIMIWYIFRNSTKLGGQARARHAAVTCLHQSRVEGDEQRWTVRQQHQHLQSLDTELRSSHVTVMKWYSCPSTLQQVYTTVPRYQKKSVILFHCCLVDNFSHFTF